jgi:hypothetical protein
VSCKRSFAGRSSDALDEEQARISLLALLEQNIEAVAVALSRFFKDPAYGRRVRELSGRRRRGSGRG